MRKPQTKKNGKRTKNTSARSSRFLNIATILLIVLTSFSIGIVFGLMRSFPVSYHPPIIASAKEISSDYVQPVGDVKVPILVYHYVEFVKDHGDTVRKSLNIIPPIFENQIKTLKEEGYTFIMAADLGLYLDGKKPLPQKPVILTFDDGYEDFYTDVFPILRRHNVVVTSYIISGVLGHKNYMNLQQLKEIALSGLVEIGAHSVHHPNLKALPVETVEKEIFESKQMLENALGIKVVSFAYPYGGYTDEAEKLVEKAGYTNAVGTKGGNIVNQKNRYVLFRIHPGIATGHELIKELK